MSVAAYDAIAEWYDQSVRRGALLSADTLITSAAFDLVGEVGGQRVCDLACGQGNLARPLAARGAQVTGIDLSRRLLEIAAGEEEAEPLGIVYRAGDAQNLTTLALGTFDGVLCNLALMDIPDVAAVFRGVAHILRPGGWFVFTITHPCFQAPPSQSYYDEGFWKSDNLSGVRGQVGAYHRTLSTYLNAVSEAGLSVERFAEPQLPGRDRPVVLIVRCRRGAEVGIGLT